MDRGLVAHSHLGHHHVRRVFAAYLRRVRAVRTTPEPMLMSNGFSGGIASVVTMLVAGRIAVEDPGGYEPRRRVESAGAEIVPVPVDDDGLVQVAALSRYAIRSPARGLVVGFGQPTPAELRRAATIIGHTLRR